MRVQNALDDAAGDIWQALYDGPGVAHRGVGQLAPRSQGTLLGAVVGWCKWKPVLKAPGVDLLVKLKYDILAFKFCLPLYLCPYTVGGGGGSAGGGAGGGGGGAHVAPRVVQRGGHAGGLSPGRQGELCVLRRVRGVGPWQIACHVISHI